MIKCTSSFFLHTVIEENQMVGEGLGRDYCCCLTCVWLLYCVTSVASQRAKQGSLRKMKKLVLLNHLQRLVLYTIFLWANLIWPGSLWVLSKEVSKGNLASPTSCRIDQPKDVQDIILVYMLWQLSLPRQECFMFNTWQGCNTCNSVFDSWNLISICRHKHMLFRYLP